MNQPNFEEMDALMGEGSGSRSRGAEARVVDMEPAAPGPRPRKVKKSGNRALVLAAATIAVIGLGAGAAYFAMSTSRVGSVASEDVIAETLGIVASNGAPQSAAGAQPEPAPILDAASVASSAMASPHSEPSALPAQALGATGALPMPATPDPELQAKVEALQAELDVVKAEKDAAEKALEAAKNRPPSVVTRDANTSFILIETLIDGAVLRDRAGNEVIVPKGGTVQVAGNRLSTGAPR